MHLFTVTAVVTASPDLPDPDRHPDAPGFNWNLRLTAHYGDVRTYSTTIATVDNNDADLRAMVVPACSAFVGSFQADDLGPFVGITPSWSSPDGFTRVYVADYIDHDV